MITEEQKTFFLLKFGADIDQVFEYWLEDKIVLSKSERETLSELINFDTFDMIDLKAMFSGKSN